MIATSDRKKKTRLYDNNMLKPYFDIVLLFHPLLRGEDDNVDLPSTELVVGRLKNSEIIKFLLFDFYQMS